MFKHLKKTYVIAEAGINSNGDMHLAKKMIYAAKQAGADCVKFQKRDIDSVYTQEELNSPRQSPWGTTFRQQKEGIEFNEDEFLELHKYANIQNIDFSASAWDYKSLALLRTMRLPFLKIPSALANDKEYLKRCSETGLPLVLSTGMNTLYTVYKIVRYLESCNAKLEAILHCVSSYPTKNYDVRLNTIKQMDRMFNGNLFVGVATTDDIINGKYVIGYSGHDELINTGPLAVACGAKIIERHVTLDKEMYGSDQKASLDFDEFAEMIRKIRIAETVLGDGDKFICKDELPIIKKLRKIDDFT